MKVLWVTNLDAPYRRPVWAAIGETVRLRVLLLDGSIAGDTSANRGADWEVRAGAERTYNKSVVRSIRLARGEARYYIPASILRLAGADVVVLGGWESPSYWLIALGAWLRGAARVGFYESHRASFAHSRGLIAALRSRWFRGLHAVITPGDASRDTVLAMGVGPERVFSGFNAVDVRALAAGADRHRTRSVGHRFLYVGQLIERKNVSSLLRAFAQIRGEDDSLTIVGRGNQELLLRRLTADLGLNSAIRFVGYVPNEYLGVTLGSADTLVLPSHSEVWGLVVNEALAAGLHVVVSRTAGVANSVRSMRGVFLTRPDLAGLAAEMAASRRAFTGPIVEPEILKFTPERFAAVCLEALYSARAVNSRTGRSAQTECRSRGLREDINDSGPGSK